MEFEAKVLAVAAERRLSPWVLINEGGDDRPPGLQAKQIRGCLDEEPDEAIALEPNVRVFIHGDEFEFSDRAHEWGRRTTTGGGLGQRAHPGDGSRWFKVEQSWECGRGRVPKSTEARSKYVSGSDRTGHREYSTWFAGTAWQKSDRWEQTLPTTACRSFVHSCSAGSDAVGGCGLEHCRVPQQGYNGSLPLRTGQITAQGVPVSGSGTKISVPPEIVVLPPIWQSPGGVQA